MVESEPMYDRASAYVAHGSTGLVQFSIQRRGYRMTREDLVLPGKLILPNRFIVLGRGATCILLLSLFELSLWPWTIFWLTEIAHNPGNYWIDQLLPLKPWSPRFDKCESTLVTHKIIIDAVHGNSAPQENVSHSKGSALVQTHTVSPSLLQWHWAHSCVHGRRRRTNRFSENMNIVQK